MNGICGCVMGPPPGGRCNACGAVGPPLHYEPYPHPYDKGHYTFTPTPITPEDIRRIVREEIERAALGKEASR